MKYDEISAYHTYSVDTSGLLILLQLVTKSFAFVCHEFWVSPVFSNGWFMKSNAFFEYLWVSHAVDSEGICWWENHQVPCRLRDSISPSDGDKGPYSKIPMSSLGRLIFVIFLIFTYTIYIYNYIEGLYYASTAKTLGKHLTWRKPNKTSTVSFRYLEVYQQPTSGRSICTCLTKRILMPFLPLNSPPRLIGLGSFFCRLILPTMQGLWLQCKEEVYIPIH